MTRYVVRSYYLSEGDEIVVLDSRLLSPQAAQRLLARLKRPDSECLEAELVKFEYKCVRAPPDSYRRVKRLDEHRLARVSGLRTAAEMFPEEP